jgi:hypothetical protein
MAWFKRDVPDSQAVTNNPVPESTVPDSPLPVPDTSDNPLIANLIGIKNALLSQNVKSHHFEHAVGHINHAIADLNNVPYELAYGKITKDFENKKMALDISSQYLLHKHDVLLSKTQKKDEYWTQEEKELVWTADDDKAYADYLEQVQLLKDKFSEAERGL